MLQTRRWSRAWPLLVIASSACQESATAPPQPVPEATPQSALVEVEAIARAIAAEGDWLERSDPAVRAPTGVPLPRAGHRYLADRVALADGVVHYRFEIPLEGSAFPLTLHRVVMEPTAHRPVRTKSAVLLQHGDAIGFSEFIFGVTSDATPDDQSFAVFLAKNGVDVWGVDQPWVHVPPGTTDFGFMAEWGLQAAVDNLETAARVARFVRAATGQGLQRIHVLGYSSGGFTAVALANQETQAPRGLRSVGGLIVVESPFKTDFEHTRGLLCSVQAGAEALLAGGTYEDTTPAFFATLGFLALTAPDAESPILPPFTNLQAALFNGASTYVFFPFTPWYHWAGAEFDAFGAPTGLRYTADAGWVDLLLSAASVQPVKFQADFGALLCDQDDVPFDDHLDEIVIPTLYVGAAGGIGEVGEYWLSLLGSQHVSSTIVRLQAEEDRTLDFGHMDVWTATDAETLVWHSVLEWLMAEPLGEGRR